MPCLGRSLIGLPCPVSCPALCSLSRSSPGTSSTRGRQRKDNVKEGVRCNPIPPERSGFSPSGQAQCRGGCCGEWNGDSLLPHLLVSGLASAGPATPQPSRQQARVQGGGGCKTALKPVHLKKRSIHANQ